MVYYPNDEASPLSPKKIAKTAPSTTNDFKTSTTAIEAASDTSPYQAGAFAVIFEMMDNYNIMIATNSSSIREKLRGECQEHSKAEEGIRCTA